jgi:undecaprenyl-diphosphatase
LGACLLKYRYFLHVFQDPQALFGIAVSALFGFLSIKYLMQLIRHYSYAIFSYYRFAFGALVFAFYLVR